MGIEEEWNKVKESNLKVADVIRFQKERGKYHGCLNYLREKLKNYESSR